MKTQYVLKVLLFWMVIFIPVQASAEDLGALRLSQMKGDIQIQSKGLAEWNPAAINLPLREGDRLWVPENAWAQVETRDGSVVRIDTGSSLEILAVEEDSLQLYLSQGQAYLNFRQERDSMLQLDTPVSSIRMYDSSTLNVALVKNGHTEISVFRGAVYAENRSGEVRVAAGKMLSMDDGLPSLMSLGPPSDWEKWNREWDDSLVDEEGSEQYLPQELAGYGRDLSRNGRWVQTPEYGHVWTPTTHISVDWAPYRQGRWVWVGNDYVWIAREPWGWAPYHYGRWSYISLYGWCWVPPRRNEVFWGPGYVSWVSTANTVAWVPLAPVETYYGYGYYGPHSVNITNINITKYNVVYGRNYRNVHVQNAVTVVHRDTFLRGQHRDIGQRENPFLRERVNIGRPRIEPERRTMMPIIRDIPKEHKPPVQLRTIQGRTENGERRIVRERDRSVFTPTAAPQPLTPTIRMNPDTIKKGESRKRREADGRQQVQDDAATPRQVRDRLNNNRRSTQDVNLSAPEESQVVPTPAVEQPALREEEAAPVNRGRQNVQEDNAPPGQVRERPTSSRNRSGEAMQAPPESQQITPPPAAPVPVEEQPALREEGAVPASHGRQQVQEDIAPPEQVRERPTSSRNRSGEARQAPPERQQVMPPPAALPAVVPVPVQEQPAQENREELKRLREQQAAEMEAAKQAAADNKALEASEPRQRGMRPTQP